MPSITFFRSVSTSSSGQSTATIANNQVAAANVTGALVNHSLYRGFIFKYDISRKTGTNESRTIGSVAFFWRALSSTWDMGLDNFDGDSHGISWSITSGGQVQYTSDSMSGTGYVGKASFTLEPYSA